MSATTTDGTIDKDTWQRETQHLYDEWNRLQGGEGANDLYADIVKALAPEPGGYRELAQRLHAAATAFEALADLPDTIDRTFKEAVRQERELARGSGVLGAAWLAGLRAERPDEL